MQTHMYQPKEILLYHTLYTDLHQPNLCFDIFTPGFNSSFPITHFLQHKILQKISARWESTF